MRVIKHFSGLLVALALSSLAAPARADPPAYTVSYPNSPGSTSGSQSQTWTSSDRFALVGVLVFGLSSGLGGFIALSEADSKAAKAAKMEKDMKAQGESCPGESESYCNEIKTLRDESSRQKFGGYFLFVMSGLLLGVALPAVIWSGFKKKEPSPPNLIMKVVPSFGPGQAGLMAVGHF